jgi:hypothetical protein
LHEGRAPRTIMRMRFTSAPPSALLRAPRSCGLRTGWLVGLLVVAACANNVPQGRSTGPDGKPAGATPLVLKDGEARGRGVVTYPGGDRVDWRVIQLPEGKHGRLELSMSYATPRPGLKLAFDVFDEWNAMIVSSDKGKSRIRTASLDQARGKYFVRIYAPRRGDAGAYKLDAAFHEDVDVTAPSIPANIPDPPKLPDVPPPPSTCEVFDPRDPVCGTLCPPGAPPNWKGCAGPTTTPPPPPVAPPVTPTPPAAKPLVVRMLTSQTVNGALEVTVGGGSDAGVTDTWKVQVLRGATKVPLAGGSGTILRINKTTTLIRVKLTPDQALANPTILLSPGS